MKAWVQTGGELALDELPDPEPKRGQVLVRVLAAGLNRADWELSTGASGLMKLPGHRLKRPRIPGSDIAGTIEAVGPGVREFKKGDAVFGSLFGRFGGLAELVAAPAAQMLPLPRGLDFTAAAAVPQSAVLAHQAMTRPGPLPKGSRILINGAGGGVGTFAVQMARAAGLVICVADRGSKLHGLRELGARETYDCEREDVAATIEPVGRIIDLHASRPLPDIARMLARGGQYWAVGGDLSALLKISLFGGISPAARGRKIAVLTADQTREALAAALPLVERGIVVPKVDRVHPMRDAARALDRLGRGEVFGKLVVRVS